MRPIHQCMSGHRTNMQNMVTASITSNLCLQTMILIGAMVACTKRKTGILGQSYMSLGCRSMLATGATSAQTQSELQSMEAIVFGQDDEVSYSSSDLRRTLKMIHKSNQVTWYIMATHGSGYRGYQGICNFCGAVMWCAWTPRSTRGWRDDQRANLLAFLGLEVPLSLMHPLELTLPMV